MTGFQEFQTRLREARETAKRAIPSTDRPGRLIIRLQVSGYGRNGREHCRWLDDELNPWTRERLVQMLVDLSFAFTYHEDFQFRLVVTSKRWGEIASTDVTDAIDLINTGG